MKQLMTNVVAVVNSIGSRELHHCAFKVTYMWKKLTVSMKVSFTSLKSDGSVKQQPK